MNERKVRANREMERREEIQKEGKTADLRKIKKENFKKGENDIT